MNRFRNAAKLLPAFLLCACASAPPAPPAVPPPTALPPPPAADFELRLYHGGCRGGCANYDLVIQADGGVDYLGHAHVAIAGAQRGHIEADTLAALRAHIIDIGLAGKSGRYLHGTSECGDWTPDQPTVVLEIWQDGAWQRFEHDLGCAGALSSLLPLEQSIDATVHSAQWVYGGALY
jgi:uncharacterized protein DUF6438